MPKWDIVPTLRDIEEIPIPEVPDGEWCAMVNYMYAGRGYQLQMLADHYSVAKMSEDGHKPTQSYYLREPKDYQGDPDEHYIIGLFNSIEMRPDWKSDSYSGPLHKVPFVRLTHAVDLDEIRQLTVPNQHVLVPVTRIQELRLEK